jgi:hypothetical protein
MNIDTGLAVVLAAVLIFYLRLIVLQRERAKRTRRELEAARADAASRKTRQKKGVLPAPAPNYSILSKNRVDLAIAGIGGLAIIFGALLNANVIQSAALQPYWWLPTALGIVAFSWAFKL